jgi:hypothetical protein
LRIFSASLFFELQFGTLLGYSPDSRKETPVMKYITHNSLLTCGAEVRPFVGGWALLDPKR